MTDEQMIPPDGESEEVSDVRVRPDFRVCGIGDVGHRERAAVSVEQATAVHGDSVVVVRRDFGYRLGVVDVGNVRNEPPGGVDEVALRGNLPRKWLERAAHGGRHPRLERIGIVDNSEPAEVQRRIRARPIDCNPEAFAGKRQTIDQFRIGGVGDVEDDQPVRCSARQQIIPDRRQGGESGTAGSRTAASLRPTLVGAEQLPILQIVVGFVDFEAAFLVVDRATGDVDDIPLHGDRSDGVVLVAGFCIDVLFPNRLELLGIGDVQHPNRFARRLEPDEATVAPDPVLVDVSRRDVDAGMIGNLYRFRGIRDVHNEHTGALAWVRPPQIDMILVGNHVVDPTAFRAWIILIERLGICCLGKIYDVHLLLAATDDEDEVAFSLDFHRGDAIAVVRHVLGTEGVADVNDLHPLAATHDEMLPDNAHCVSAEPLAVDLRDPLGVGRIADIDHIRVTQTFAAGLVKILSLDHKAERVPVRQANPVPIAERSGLALIELESPQQRINRQRAGGYVDVGPTGRIGQVPPHRSQRFVEPPVPSIFQTARIHVVCQQNESILLRPELLNLMALDRMRTAVGQRCNERDVLSGSIRIDRRGILRMAERHSPTFLAHQCGNGTHEQRRNENARNCGETSRLASTIVKANGPCLHRSSISFLHKRLKTPSNIGEIGTQEWLVETKLPATTYRRTSSTTYGPYRLPSFEAYTFMLS